MSDLFLRKHLREICQSGATLLWLEGAKHHTVHAVRLTGRKLILKLDQNVTRVISFERYTTTKVGLQFWSQNQPGVLYKWDQVPSGTLPRSGRGTTPQADFPDDDPPPPNMAA
jgi:hypothetical protein